MSGPVFAALLAQAAPLAASLVILLALRRRPRAAAGLAVAALVVALGATGWLVLTVAVPDTTVLATSMWLPLETGPGLAFGVLLDTLSTSMAFVVAAVTLAVMVFSLGYMAGDPGFARYYGFLALFAWAMLGLVLASNLLQTLVFWELVGLASFLLIGFWFEKPAPAAAARKAFIMTRVGDVGFLLGVLLLIRAMGNATIPDLVARAAVMSPSFVAVVAALLLCGVIGKSAQGPLFSWLPDAMEGPTPVSALLHSATMVAAGVYLVARMHGLFMAAPEVMRFLLWMSVATALAAATMAMVATDIKRVLAFSSISQLAYMLMGLAAGSVAAGFFHLVTHAGFKALLFLSAGVFIHHAHSNEMKTIAEHTGAPRGGVIGLLAGSLALAGVIPFAGYFSKEAVLAALGEHAGTAALALAYLGAGLTAYYTFRMVFLTLGSRDGAESGMLDAAERTPSRSAASSGHGDATTGPLDQTPRDGVRVVRSSGPAVAPAHGSLSMASPVLVLAALTLVLGRLGAFFAERLSPGLEHHGALEFGVGPLAALALAGAGILLAWYEFGRRGAARVGFVDRVPALRDFFANNWYVDRLYEATVLRLTGALSRAARWNDQTVLDGGGDGLAAGTVGGGRFLARLQSGFVQTYVAVLMTVVAALALWVFRGAWR